MAQIVSAAIAILLLGLYGYAVQHIARSPTTPPSEPIQTVLTLVGGLVAALVVAVLAKTPPDKNPAVVFSANALPGTVTTVVTIGYLAAWLGCGTWLLIVWLGVPAVTPELSGAAKSWLGLAVAAAYAFFGLKKS
jgi:uncharacterized protein YacL